MIGVIIIPRTNRGWALVAMPQKKLKIGVVQFCSSEFTCINLTHSILNFSSRLKKNAMFMLLLSPTFSSQPLVLRRGVALG